uniref:Uncharacterized protein n=1 Tax=Salix viminalis TaxID=40686 RepID=A0A6N2KZ41_SALVM
MRLSRRQRRDCLRRMYSRFTSLYFKFVSVLSIFVGSSYTFFRRRKSSVNETSFFLLFFFPHRRSIVRSTPFPFFTPRAYLKRSR